MSGFVSQWNKNNYEFTFEFANWYNFSRNFLMFYLQNFREIAVIETQPHRVFDPKVLYNFEFDPDIKDLIQFT